ncbi:Myb-like DNA-binding domain containing protein [Tritrichomonas foetus]|uniref:Myb-like DNA-binding domain containing protein n=1 Tax=Tritrichomonas foetus TaxID=1144522 RepID=A0A1J4JNW0_9EUKA|nr:Myb-like DNA-binding domain containing protein [Tritrichomonas foetus]|eukprot:OHT00817.1 Myb-like DNA-binding domain containing protein [Tritrichomonas foetus]
MYSIPVFAINHEPSQRSRFSLEEDENLKKLVAMYETPHWNEIARYMENRTPRQCRERFNNYLRPEIKNGPWTPEDDELLLRLYNEMGPKWSLIVKSFNGRSAVNVKNHHSSLISQRSVIDRSKRIAKTKTNIKADPEINDPKMNKEIFYIDGESRNQDNENIQEKVNTCDQNSDYNTSNNDVLLLEETICESSSTTENNEHDAISKSPSQNDITTNTKIEDSKDDSKDEEIMVEGKKEPKVDVVFSKMFSTMDMNEDEIWANTVQNSPNLYTYY